jgi:uncharacterized BrkB/YihY/UPF0761 family membrane protein
MQRRVRGTAERTARVVSSSIDRSSSWIERQEPTTRRGAAIGWFRLYLEADGPLYAMLFSAYVFITVVPATLAISSYVYRDPGRLADRLTGRLALGSSTSALLHGVLVGAATHRFVSTFIAVANVVVFGSGYGRLLQLAHTRAWRLEPSTSRLRDQERYLAVLAVLVGVVTLYLVETTQVRDGSVIGLLTVPIWILGFVAYFVWAPWMLLHRRISAVDLVPGAAFVALGFVGLRLFARVLLARWLTWYSTNYGGFGIVLALFSWLLVLGTLVVVGAALSPAVKRRRVLLRGAEPSRTASSRRAAGRAVSGVRRSDGARRAASRGESSPPSSTRP